MKIAVIDSGINLEFKQFNYIDIECINITDLSKKAVDENGHGTASVAEIIKINRQADILVIKVLDENARASLGALLKALRYCLARDDIDIINLSLSCEINDRAVISVFESIIKSLLDKGITIVSSVANTYGKLKNDYGYPANFAGVIKVRHEYSDTCYVEYNKADDQYIYHGTYNLVPWKNNEYKFYRANSSAASKAAGILSEGAISDKRGTLTKYYRKEIYESQCNIYKINNVIRSYCIENYNSEDYIEIQSETCLNLLRRLESELEISLDYMDFSVEDFLDVDRLVCKCSRLLSSIN